MKTIQIIILFIGLSFAITSCSKSKKIKASGDVTTVEKTVLEYSRLDVSHAFDVVVNYSDTEEKVLVEADDNLQEYILVETDGDRLIIRFDRSMHIRGKATLKVHLTTKELHSFDVSGASTVTLNNELETTDAKVELSGASSFEGTINATTGTFDFSGASESEFSGAIQTVHVEGSGASIVKGYDLIADVMNVDLSGASELRCTVNDELDVKASGASNVRYKGNGVVVYQDLSGASTLRKED